MTDLAAVAGDIYAEAIDNGMTPADFLVGMLRKQYPTTEGRAQAMRELYRVINDGLRLASADYRREREQAAIAAVRTPNVDALCVRLWGTHGRWEAANYGSETYYASFVIRPGWEVRCGKDSRLTLSWSGGREAGPSGYPTFAPAGWGLSGTPCGSMILLNDRVSLREIESQWRGWLARASAAPRTNASRALAWWRSVLGAE